jgi:hypothetical protein
MSRFRTKGRRLRGEFQSRNDSRRVDPSSAAFALPNRTSICDPTPHAYGEAVFENAGRLLKN